MKQIRAMYLPVFLSLVLLLSVFSGCGGEEASGAKLLAKEPVDRCAVSKALTYDHSMKLKYAETFAVDSMLTNSTLSGSTPIMAAKAGHMIL